MMKQQDLILKSIDHQLEIFTEQYLMAREHGQIIPLIEIDLMKHSIRSLYQQLQFLQQIAQEPVLGLDKNYIAKPEPVVQFSREVENHIPVQPSQPAQEPVAEKVIVQEVKIEEVEIKQVEAEELELNPVISEVTSSPNIQFEMEAEPIIIEEVITPMDEVVHEEEPEVIQQENTFTNPTPAPILEVKKSAPVMASLFDEAPVTVGSKFKEQSSVYDKFAKNNIAPTIADKLSVKPVTDLKKSIGINERFSFINELFSGNQQLFMESIDKINSLNAYDEARRILYEDLAGTMNWNTSTKPFSDLDELVKRRFSA